MLKLSGIKSNFDFIKDEAGQKYIENHKNLKYKAYFKVSVCSKHMTWNEFK